MLTGLLAVGASVLLGFASYGATMSIGKHFIKKKEVHVSKEVKQENPILEGLRFTPDEKRAVDQHYDTINTIMTADIDSDEYKEALIEHVNEVREYMSEEEVEDLFIKEGFPKEDIQYMVKYAMDPDNRELTPSKGVGKSLKRKRIQVVDPTQDFKPKSYDTIWEEWSNSPAGKFMDSINFADEYAEDKKRFRRKHRNDKWGDLYCGRFAIS